MSTPRFLHDDVVRLTRADQVGVVKEVQQTDTGYRYGIEVRTEPPTYVKLPEAELELVKPANTDETGLHIRYIT
jgi:hypothetical protein